MTFKAKVLRIVIFAMKEFNYEHSHLYTLILEDLQEAQLAYQESVTTQIA